MGSFINKVGKKYGKLVVVRRAGNNKYGQTCWICLCDCGNESIVMTGNLTNGHTASCGCLRWARTTHGLAKDRLYRIWVGMKGRCLNSNNTHYKYYGGRGISICEEWMDFVNFHRDMNPTYKEGLSIDRINNDLGYSKYNCRWTTQKIQSNNKSNNNIIGYGSIFRTIEEWASARKINSSTLRKRLDRGWSIQSALFKPAGNYKKSLREGA